MGYAPSFRTSRNHQRCPSLDPELWNGCDMYQMVPHGICIMSPLISSDLSPSQMDLVRRFCGEGLVAMVTNAPRPARHCLTPFRGWKCLRDT